MHVTSYTSLIFNVVEGIQRISTNLNQVGKKLSESRLYIMHNTHIYLQSGSGCGSSGGGSRWFRRGCGRSGT